jgi:hypothetical protein
LQTTTFWGQLIAPAGQDAKPHVLALSHSSRQVAVLSQRTMLQSSAFWHITWQSDSPVQLAWQLFACRQSSSQTEPEQVKLHARAWSQLTLQVLSAAQSTAQLPVVSAQPIVQLQSLHVWLQPLTGHALLQQPSPQLVHAVCGQSCGQAQVFSVLFAQHTPLPQSSTPQSCGQSQVVSPAATQQFPSPHAGMPQSRPQLHGDSLAEQMASPQTGAQSPLHVLAFSPAVAQQMPSPQVALPQSAGQAQRSSLLAAQHTASPQLDAPQSRAQLHGFSPPAAQHTPSPQLGAPQSLTQLQAFSLPAAQQMPSPQLAAPQSPGQLQRSSPSQHTPSPHEVAPQSCAQLQGFSPLSAQHVPSPHASASPEQPASGMPASGGPVSGFPVPTGGAASVQRVPQPASGGGMLASGRTGSGCEPSTVLASVLPGSVGLAGPQPPSASSMRPSLQPAPAASCTSLSTTSPSTTRTLSWPRAMTLPIASRPSTSSTSSWRSSSSGSWSSTLSLSASSGRGGSGSISGPYVLPSSPCPSTRKLTGATS